LCRFFAIITTSACSQRYRAAFFGALSTRPALGSLTDSDIDCCNSTERVMPVRVGKLSSLPFGDWLGRQAAMSAAATGDVTDESAS
jgi:hypothetical protein